MSKLQDYLDDLPREYRKAVPARVFIDNSGSLNIMIDGGDTFILYEDDLDLLDLEEDITNFN